MEFVLMIASLVGTYAGFVPSLEFWKIEIKPRKNGKKSWVFLSSYNKCFISFFFGLVKSYSISPVCLQRGTKKALFLTSFKGLY